MLTRSWLHRREWALTSSAHLNRTTQMIFWLLSKSKCYCVPPRLPVTRPSCGIGDWYIPLARSSPAIIAVQKTPVTFLPRTLCTCCFLGLESSSLVHLTPNSRVPRSRTSFRSFLECLLISELSSEHTQCNLLLTHPSLSIWTSSLALVSKSILYIPYLSCLLSHSLASSLEAGILACFYLLRYPHA